MDKDNQSAFMDDYKKNKSIFTLKMNEETIEH